MSVVEERRQIYRLPICGLMFAAACAFLAYLGFGLTHHFPSIARVVLWVLEPSKYAKQALDALFGIAVSGSMEIVLIFVVQWIVGILFCAALAIVLSGIGSKE